MTDVYRAQERYIFGWTDPHGMCLYTEEVPAEESNDGAADFMTNFMGTVIIMIPVTAIAYWFWF